MSINPKLRPADKLPQLPEVGRIPDGKIFDLGGGKRRLVKSAALVHYEKDGALEDIDLTPREEGGVIIVDKAPYILKVQKSRVAFEYTSRRGGTTTVELTAPAYTPKEAVVVDNEVRWIDLVPGLDIYIRFHSFGVRTYRIIKSPGAPHSFFWKVTETKRKAFQNKKQTLGSEKDGHHLQIDYQETNTQDFGESIEYIAEETVGGQYAATKSRITRVKEWRDLTPDNYPLTIDPDITETIVDTADDGNSNADNGNMYTTSNLVYVGTSGGDDLVGGVRFRAVDVPQAVTIDLANLKTFTKTTANQTGKIYADDVDDAPTWQTTNEKMHQITKTTASADYTPSVDETTETNDVTNIVQEVVNRAGWASGNDMRFALFPGTITGSARFSDLSLGDGNEAILEIDYTDIIFVQRGTASLGSTDASTTATLSKAVDTSKAFVIVDANTTETNPDHNKVLGYFTTEGASQTGLTFERGLASGTVTIYWQVIEHSALSVQHGSIAIADASGTTGDGTITAVNLAKTMVIASHKATASSSITQWAGSTPTTHLTSTTNVRATLGATAAGDTTIRYQVVEFTDATTVQHETLSIGATANNATATISAVVLADSFIVGTYRTTESGQHQTKGGQFHFNSTTEVEALRGDTSGTTTCEVFVVELPSTAITQSHTIADVGDPTAQTITEVGHTSETFTIGSGRTSSGTGGGFDRNAFSTELSSTTNVNVRLGDTGATAPYELFVVELQDEPAATALKDIIMAGVIPFPR